MLQSIQTFLQLILLHAVNRVPLVLLVKDACFTKVLAARLPVSFEQQVTEHMVKSRSLTSMAIRMFLAVSIRGFNVEDLERSFSINSSICHSFPLSEVTPVLVEGSPAVDHARVSITFRQESSVLSREAENCDNSTCLSPMVVFTGRCECFHEIYRTKSLSLTVGLLSVRRIHVPLYGVDGCVRMVARAPFLLPVIADASFT